MIQEKLKWLMLFRVAVAIILLTTGIIVQFRESGSLMNAATSTFYAIAGLFFFLSILYIPLIRHLKNPSRLANSQTLIDIIIITFVVYISGGAASPLSFLYVLTVVSATIVSYRSGGFWAASLSSIFYGAMVNSEYYRIFPSMEEVISGTPQFLPENILYVTTSNIAAFFFVAFLSGYLAVQARKIETELIEKKIDYEALKTLNNDIVKNISMGLITIDSELNITSFNSAAEAITGYSLEDVYTSSIFSVFSDFKKGLENIDAIQRDQPQRWETWHAGKNGENYYLGFSSSSLKNAEGTNVGEIVFFQDLTALKTMEKELLKADRLAAVGRFAASVAHEVRNPLASISGSIELLKKNLIGSRKGTNSRLMDIVLREVERLNKLITEFLIYAKPAAPQKKEADLNKIMEETVEVFRNASLGDKKIKITTGKGEIPLVLVDPSQFEQVLWNLLGNAADAIEHSGAIDLQAHIFTTDEERKDVEIKISDDGCGIPGDEIEKIFDPFYTSKEEGNGLGLSIAYGIIEAHGGKLSVASEPGQGTTFTILLPLR